ncbi:MAG: hypothetical protein N0A00_01515 [Candidatus Bathyarchaeota archaeon]|nr:hypothetical protein [Candidatus Bathyarchaeota archaeon]
MSEEEIAGLMAWEMARDACETVGGDCKARCEAVLRKIIIEGEGFELLDQLSEADKRAVKEKLKEFIGQNEEKPVVADQKQL